MTHDRRGFTVVEMLVAAGVFAVVISIAAGVFVNALKTQRAAAAIMAVNNDMSLTLEQVARQIRLGAVLQPRPVNGEAVESDFLMIRNQRNQREFYAYVRPGTPVGTFGAIIRCVKAMPAECEASDFLPMTSLNVFIDRVKFRISGGTQTEPFQVTIVMRIGSRNETAVETFTDIQTTVTPRE